MKAPIIEVLSGSPESLRAQVDAAVIETLDQGKSSLVLSLDALRAFDNSAINAIVRGLRTLRAVGGTMRLVTERDDHRKALALTGLDRVFEVYASRDEAAFGVAS
jgi:anti-sigma B factor antagonist